MLSKNIQTFLGCDNEYSESNIIIFGAPFDSTTSYRPGARFASRTMRAESYSIETFSPYQNLDLEDVCVFDAGDLELSFGNTSLALNDIEEFTKKLLSDDKIPLMIGGEHLVTLGAVRAFIKKYPDLHIIHFDAHADLRDDYIGEPLSHATVMRRVWDLTGDDKIFQFGIRSGDKSEFLWAKDHVAMQKFNFDGLSEIISKLSGKPVYLSIDLDVIDPSILPGTGTPEAGGVTFGELLNAIITVSKLNIVGCDLNELSPIYDQSGTSTAVALKVFRELILAISKK